jgi:lysophospholipase L1-like esterase
MTGFVCIVVLAGCGSLRSSAKALPEVVDLKINIPPPTAQLPQAEQTKKKDCSVVLYGDSILHCGYGGSMRLEEPPGQTLHRLRPSYRIEDLTVNGETATERSRLFEKEHRSARFVVIGHGINDVARGLSLELALRRMIAISREEGREVILTGLSRQPISVPGRAEGDATIRHLAKELHVEYADWGGVPFARNEMADVIHPAKPYSDRLVQRIADALDRLAPQCSQPPVA